METKLKIHILESSKSFYDWLGLELGADYFIDKAQGFDHLKAILENIKKAHLACI